MSFFLKTVSLSLVLVFFYIPDVCAEDDYRLGEGMKIPSTPFRVGGYINVEYEDPTDEEGVFSFDDLSFFVFGDILQRWRFFSEVEDEHFLEVPRKGDSSTHENWQIERLYVDYLQSERLNIRVGKFLTPIGTWNEIHADPLVWTVSRPIVTFASFPEFITGLSLFGDFAVNEHEFSYSIALQNNESINERTGFRRTHESYGMRFRWLHPSGLEIGVPAMYYREYEINDRIYLSGLDVAYKTPSFEIRGETTWSAVDAKQGGWSKEYGYYLQGVYNLTERHFMVLRHEYFRARGGNGEHRAFVVAGVYKPKPQIAFKFEYQIRDGSLVFTGEEGVSNRERFLASFSILF